MVANETFSRVRQIHSACGPSAGSSAQRHKTARGRTSQTGSVESEPPRPQAKTKAEGCQALRFLGPRGNVGILVERRYFTHLAGDFSPSQTLANDLTYSQVKSVTVIHVRAIVVSKRLFIQIAEQVKRLNTDIRFR